MKNKGALRNKIKCIICGHKNRLYADYCYKCGHEFTLQEKEFAKEHTIYSFFKKYGNMTENSVWRKITKNKVIRFVFVVLLAFLTYKSFSINGPQVKILNYYRYDLNYSSYYDEYYVVVKDDENAASLKLFVPNNCQKIVVEHYDDLNMITNQTEYKLDDRIKLPTTNADYYIINATYKDKTKSYIKVHIRNEKENTVQK